MTRLLPFVAIAVVLGSAAATPGSASGQTLHQRKPSPDGPPQPAPASATAHTPVSAAAARAALPSAAEGEYRWGEPGEVIELYLEGGALHGYLTRRSDRAASGSAPLNFRFTTSGVAAGGIQFTTSRIHGDWYTFTGRVTRGAAASPRLDGYYLLVGTLTLHPGADNPENLVVVETSQTATAAPAPAPIAKQVTLKLAGISH